MAGESGDATFERLRDIICETLDVEPDLVTPEASFAGDLKADSLGLVELIMAFEEQYGVDIPDKDAEEIRTVGDALAYIKTHAADA